VGSDRGAYCSPCYTGHYPVEFPRDEATYLQLALKLDKDKDKDKHKDTEAVTK